MKEIWKDILGWEGLYQVSNLGRVKNLSRLVQSRYGSFRKIEEHILKISINNKGYCTVELNRNSKGSRRMIHRLVAKAFISNIENKPTVNHKNGIKTDNSVDNLEWATHKEQINHADINGLRNINGCNNSNTNLTERDVQIIRYMVFQLDFAQNIVAEFFEVGTSSINRIINGLAYKNLPVDYGVVVRNG